MAPAGLQWCHLFLALDLLGSWMQMVIMNITDHLTRVQQQGSPDTQRVYGVLYGKQRGMAVEVCTSFELNYAPREEGGIVIDKKYLEENISLRESPRAVHPFIAVVLPVHGDSHPPCLGERGSPRNPSISTAANAVAGEPVPTVVVILCRVCRSQGSLRGL
jgi:hypothetical protein